MVGFAIARRETEISDVRGVVIVGSALIPALVALRELSAVQELARVFAVASIIVSLEVSVSRVCLPGATCGAASGRRRN